MESKQLKVVPNKHNTARIPEEKWEEHKSKITELYQSKTLKEVMKHMKNLGFKAEKRQYIHRLGSIWNIKKYKKTMRGPRPQQEALTTVGSHQRLDPSSSDEDHALQSPLAEATASTPPSYSYLDPRPQVSPGLFIDTLQDQPYSFDNSLHRTVDEEPRIPLESGLPMHRTFSLDTTTSGTTYFHIGDLLRNVGDRTRAFQIYKALYCRDYAIQGREPPSQSLIGHLAVSIAICASTHEEAEDARSILCNSFPWLHFPPSSSTSTLPVTEPPCDSHTHLLSGILLAHLCAISSKPRLPFEQIKRIVKDLVDEHNRLAELPKRWPGLIVDVLVYFLLHYVLLRYNDGGLTGREYHGDYERSPLDVRSILTQYVSQLLSSSSEDRSPDAAGQPIKDCILWCLDVLGRELSDGGTGKGKEVHTVPGWKDLKDIKDTLRLFCWLWCHMLGSPNWEPSWARDAEQKLGISPTQLLYTVAFMLTPSITVHGPAKTYIELTTPPSSAVSAASIILLARDRAHSLAQLRNSDVLDRFLDQVQVCNPLRSAATLLPGCSEAVLYVESFLNSKLRIKLPPPTESNERYRGDFAHKQPRWRLQPGTATLPSQGWDLDSGRLGQGTF